MARKPTYEELEQRVRELEKRDVEHERMGEALRESARRLQISYDQSIIYAQQLNEEITERKQAEDSLRKARDELGRRVEERTAELIRTTEQLKLELTERKLAQEKLLTYHEKLRALASELSLTEERERRRIAVEVHDHIGQNLAFAKIKLGTLRASTSSAGLAGTMDEVIKLVDEAIQDTRSLISQLSSPVLYEMGFVPAVEWLTQQIQKRHNIVLDFEDDGKTKPIGDDVCILLFRAVRELLVNVAKHAQAHIAKVSITRYGNKIRVNVEDDGVGFDTAEIGPDVDKAGGFGFFSIRERLNPLGGHLKVESEPGRGTRVSLTAPLKYDEETKERKPG